MKGDYLLGLRSVLPSYSFFICQTARGQKKEMLEKKREENYRVVIDSTPPRG